MASVTVELPSVLAQVVKGAREVAVEAVTLAAALDGLFDQHPILKVHLFDEDGELRRHVLCFHNDVNTRWRDSLQVALSDGDRITIMQAVSGG